MAPQRDIQGHTRREVMILWLESARWVPSGRVDPPCACCTEDSRVAMAKQTRRKFLESVAAGTAVLSMPAFPQIARGAGKLSLGLWDHWVPGENAALKAM